MVLFIGFHEHFKNRIYGIFLPSMNQLLSFVKCTRVTGIFYNAHIPLLTLRIAKGEDSQIKSCCQYGYGTCSYPYSSCSK